MRIAVDAMGSDRAPHVEVQGAVIASMSSDYEILLVGDEAELRPTLAGYRNPGKVSIVHASEAIVMEDSPASAVRRKKDSSLLVALRLVKEGKADAVVSAGNTGAVMLAARTVLGPIQGVSRSAICQQLPTLNGHTLLLDLGANVDCTPRHLCEFAEMGLAYARQTLGIENPRVGLANIGEETIKGNEAVKATHRILSEIDHINFVGNVEPKMLFRGEADVVVADGFVGNILLKTAEAVGSLFSTSLKREIKANIISKLGGLLSLGAFRRLKKTLDPNEYPGAPLLGINGITIILHGACSARGITSGIIGAARAVETRLNDHIRDGILRLRESEAMREYQEKNG
jgi:glycerol-3-phosphate acyltransferase PlsX